MGPVFAIDQDIARPNKKKPKQRDPRDLFFANYCRAVGIEASDSEDIDVALVIADVHTRLMQVESLFICNLNLDFENSPSPPMHNSWEQRCQTRVFPPKWQDAQTHPARKEKPKAS